MTRIQPPSTQSQPPAPYYGQQYNAPLKINGLAVASLIIEIVSWVGGFVFLLPAFLTPLAVIFGHIA